MIPLFAVYMPHEVDGPLLQTLHSGYIGQGSRVDEFERAFGERTGNPQVIALNSGTSALTLALRMINLQPQDEVLTTPMTCTATNLPILSFSARPVWVDVNPQTGLMDPMDLLRKRTTRTRAVICVDWGGIPCDIRAIREAAPGLPIIEDAAHALGARFNGKPVGTQADYTAFSFQAIKHLTTVDGGMLAVRSENAYRRGRLLRWYGIDRENPTGDSRIDVDIREWGYKFHMNDVNATIGLVQLRHLDSVLARHRANAEFYQTHLPHVYRIPEEPIGAESAYWLFTILLPSLQDREEFKVFMRERGVQVSQVHRRNDEYAVFKPFARESLPGVDAFANHMICIPVHWALTERDRSHVLESCEEFARVGA